MAWSRPHRSAHPVPLPRQLGEQEPGFLASCAKVGIADGWARRALSAGRRLPEDVYEWVQMQKEHPPASGCKMTIIEEVPPGEFASTTLSSGEHVRVELPAGAIAGQELLFVLPPTTPDGHAEEIVAAGFAKKKGPRGITGKRSWHVRWFELTPSAVQYFEVGSDAELLSRSVLPLSSVEGFRAHETDATRIDLQLSDGGAFALKLDSADRRELWLRLLQTLTEANAARILREEQELAAGGNQRGARRQTLMTGDVSSSSVHDGEPTSPAAAGGEGEGEGEMEAEAEEEAAAPAAEEEGATSLGGRLEDEEAERERVDALFFRV